MFLKAQLICEDVRFELAGTMTLVGIHREIVAGIQMPEGIQFARLVAVTMVGGLTGVREVQHRHALRSVSGEHVSRELPFAAEAHDPTADEHVFLFGDAPLTFPAAGAYELTLELRAMRQEATYRYGFQVR